MMLFVLEKRMLKIYTVFHLKLLLIKCIQTERYDWSVIRNGDWTKKGPELAEYQPITKSGPPSFDCLNPASTCNVVNRL